MFVLCTRRAKYLYDIDKCHIKLKDIWPNTVTKIEWRLLNPPIYDWEMTWINFQLRSSALSMTIAAPIMGNAFPKETTPTAGGGGGGGGKQGSLVVSNAADIGAKKQEALKDSICMGSSTQVCEEKFGKGPESTTYIAKRQLITDTSFWTGIPHYFTMYRQTDISLNALFFFIFSF